VTTIAAACNVNGACSIIMLRLDEIQRTVADVPVINQLDVRFYAMLATITTQAASNGSE
jgi:hypothetical protein